MKRLLTIAALTVVTTFVVAQEVPMLDNNSTVESCNKFECALQDAGISFVMKDTLDVGVLDNYSANLVCDIARDQGLAEFVIVTVSAGDKKTVGGCKASEFK